MCFIDKESYIEKGYSVDGLEWTTMQSASGSYSFAKTDLYYVFDLNGEWYMPTNYNYGTVDYTIIIKDENGSIIDFVKGSVNLKDYIASIEE